MDLLWPNDFVGDKTLSMLVVGLRKALAKFSYNEAVITVRSGYRLNLAVQHKLSRIDLYFPTKQFFTGRLRLAISLLSSSVSAEDLYAVSHLTDVLTTKLLDSCNVDVFECSADLGSLEPFDLLLRVGAFRSEQNVEYNLRLVTPKSGCVWWAETIVIRRTEQADEYSAAAAGLISAIANFQQWPDGPRRWPERSSTASRSAYASASLLASTRTASGIKLARELLERERAFDNQSSNLLIGLAECLQLEPFYTGYRDRGSLEFANMLLQQAAFNNDDNSTVLALQSWRHLCDFQFDKANDCIQRALDIDSTNPKVMHRYTDYLVAMGELDDSVDAARIAVALNPSSLVLNVNLAQSLFHAGRYEQARLQALHSYRMDPQNGMALCWLGLAEWSIGDQAAAITHCQQCVEMHVDTPFVRGVLALVEGRSGNRSAVSQHLDIICADARDRPGVADAAILIYAGLGNNREMLRWQKIGIDHHSPWTLVMRHGLAQSGFNL